MKISQKTLSLNGVVNALQLLVETINPFLAGHQRRVADLACTIAAELNLAADVVEAIASHRPYRPAIGLEAAINEITNNRGKLFDAAVADACIRLFKEKNYSFN